MPYIDQNSRKNFEDFVGKINNLGICSAGELNYLITNLCHHYIKSKKINYTTLNEVIGVLECAKQEIYRRILAGYEDNKIQENGDVSLTENDWMTSL